MDVPGAHIQAGRWDVGTPRPGLLLVGHGTRDSGGVAELTSLSDLVAARLPDVMVQLGCLEFSRPTIQEAVSRLIARGVDSLVVVPVLLFAAGHAKHDIPQAIAEAFTGGVTIPYVQAAHLGTHEQVIAHSAARFQEALLRLSPLPADQTMLVLVGRGSRDPEATSEMVAFSELLRQFCGLPHVTATFYAMAEPSFVNTIESLARQPYRRIVIQPHLLFCGQILDQIVTMVEQVSQQTANQEWVICDHLGPSPRIAEALIARFRQTLT